MADADLAEVAFLLGWCSHCGREVLTAAIEAGGEADHRVCVHCDGAIAAALSSVLGDELETRGYGLLEDTSGCGRPDCGGGRCGTRSTSH
jgi:hypothetical protein